MLAGKRGNGPKQNGQANNTEAETEYDEIEGLALEQANFLENEKRIVHLELPIPACVFLECDMVLSVNFTIEKWADLFELLWLSVRVFQLIDGNSAVRIGRDFRLAERSGDGKK